MMKKQKKSTTKKQTSAPTQPPPDGKPDTPPAPHAVTDASALLALASDPNITVPGWPNRHALATCDLCHEEHQSPLTYAARLLRRGNPSPDEIAWLTRHLEAAGIEVPASA